MCLRKDDLPAGPGDLLLGRIGGAAFFIDRDQCERWRRPRFLIDVSPGAAEGFSLEGLQGVPFRIADVRGSRTASALPPQ